MDRRAFLRVGSGTVMLSIAARATKSHLVFAVEPPLSSSVEQRVALLVQAYDSHGNHRTATEGNIASIEWLKKELRRLGVQPSVEQFSVSRVDPQSCYVRVSGRRIDGVPLFDANFTGSEGVTGRLGPLGSDAEIGLAETEPFTLMEPRREQAGPLAEARRSQHKAVVLLTRGSKPGLFLLNALSFQKPFGPPMLQVSSGETELLNQAAQARANIALVAQVERTAATAFNITATIAGSDPRQAPLVITTPYSGWWQCAAERGGGLACWLEAMRALSASKPRRDCLFVAFSGHEIGFLGMDNYIKRRPDLLKRAHRWIHFGANIGAPRQPNLIHSSDDDVERWAVSVIEKEGLLANAKAARGSVPRGEAGAMHRGGAHYLTLTCGTDLFHHAADRWPDAVDVATLARYARALANGAQQLASGEA